MNWFQQIIKRPIAVCMFFTGVVLLGGISYCHLPVELMPNVDWNHVTVYTSVRGAMPPDWIEKKITEPIEEGVSALSGITKMESLSKEGRSVVVATFSAQTNMDFALVEMREKLSRLYPYLPKEVEKPVIAKYRHSDAPVMILTLTSNELSTEAIREKVDQELKERFQQLPGVANIEVVGGRERRILVEVNLERLQASGLSLQKVIETINQNNFNAVMGDLKEESSSFVIRGLSALTEIDDIQNLMVAAEATNKENENWFYLSELAEIKEDYLDWQSLSRMNQQNVVTLYIQKESTANTIEVCDVIENELKRIQGDIQIKVMQNQSEFILKAMKQLKSSLLFGGLLAVAVLYLFLRSKIALLILSLSFPFALMMSFLGMQLFGVSLNVMTLSGLTLGIGLLIDSAILVFERYFQQGPQGLLKIVPAIVASTLTTIIVFLPLLYVDAQLRKLYGGLAWTISFSLLASLLIALIFIPTLSIRFVKERTLYSPPWLEKIKAYYEQGVQKLMLFKKPFLLGLSTAFLLSLVLMFQLDRQFYPEGGSGRFTLFVELPAGAKLGVSNHVVSQLENYLKTVPEIENVTARIEGWSSKIYIQLAKKRKKTTQEVIQALRPTIDQVSQQEEAFAYFSGDGEGKGKDIRFEIFGDDMNELKQTAAQVGEVLNEIPGMVDVKMRYKPGRPESQFLLARSQVALAGFSPQQLADLLHASLRGVEATRFYQAGKEKEVLVRLQEQDRQNIKQIQDWSVVSPKGDVVHLSELGSFQSGTSPGEVWRKNKQRVIEVSAFSTNLFPQQALEAAELKIGALNLPDTVSVVTGEEFMEQKKRFGQLFLALICSIVLIYMLLASMFESMTQPLFVLLTIPLSFIGIFPLLFVLGKPITLGVVLGLILLTGIVVNNGIVLIHALNQHKELTLEKTIQVIQERLKPILMTSLTTIFGLLPLGLFASQEEVLWSPLAWTLIGGLLTSTLLIPFVFPLIFIFLGSFSRVHSTVR